MAAPGVVVALSIAKSLVEKTHGRIGFQSEQGQGSIFLTGVPTFPGPANVAAAVGPVV
ncbi:MAG TPA: hypothetical protein VES94_00885 [Burkholderiales bacterium]|nr:hypothetical protein [Burkholderiales bacterium]